MKKILIAVLLVLILTGQGISSTLRLSENFDDGDVDSPLVPIKPPTYTTASSGEYTLPEGRGGSGYCFSSGSVHDVFLQWTYSDTWYTNEIYVKFYVRYPTSQAADADHWNIKTFYPHWEGTSSYVHFSATGNKDTVEAFYYSAMDSGSLLDSGQYPQTPNAWDGNWHKYEWYINFSTTVVQFWYDDVLRGNYNYTDSVWTNALYYITFGGQDSTGTQTWTREIDDIEVWDGMPEAGDDTTPPALTSGTIAANGTTLTLAFSEAVTQGVGYADSDFDVDCSTAGSNIAVSYVSGNGTASHVYTLASTVEAGDTCNVDYAGTANHEEDAAGNDLAAIASTSVTNNSTADNTAPTLSGGSPSGTVAYSATKTISVTSSENANCRYGLTHVWADMSAMSTTGGTSHSHSLEVSASTAYTYYIVCQDAAANESTEATISFTTLAAQAGCEISPAGTGSITFGAELGSISVSQ